MKKLIYKNLNQDCGWFFNSAKLKK